MNKIRYTTQSRLFKTYINLPRIERKIKAYQNEFKETETVILRCDRIMRDFIKDKDYLLNLCRLKYDFEKRYKTLSNKIYKIFKLRDRLF